MENGSLHSFIFGYFSRTCQAISILLKSDKHSASQEGLYIFLRTSSAYIGLPIIPRKKQGNVSLVFSVQWKLLIILKSWSIKIWLWSITVITEATVFSEP